jgi:6-pyruvoyltetrahydropterin/6-carboxytetrahydropterin synthase
MSVGDYSSDLKNLLLTLKKGRESPAMSGASRNMLTVSVETCFWASHRLTLPDGSKEPVHSHNWSVTAYVGGNIIGNMGLVMDFRRIKAMLDDIVAEFDNVALDDVDYFQQNNSTAENVAKYIYEKLQPRLTKDVRLEAVKVTEEPGCSAKFVALS